MKAVLQYYEAVLYEHVNISLPHSCSPFMRCLIVALP